MIGHLIVSCFAIVIDISSTQQTDSLNQSVHPSDAYPNRNSLFPPTISASEKRVSPSKQPPESIMAEKSLAQLQQKKEHEVEQAVSAIISSNPHSAEHYQSPAFEASKQPTAESFTSDWDSLSNKWTIPQFGSQNELSPSSFPSFISTFDSDFGSLQRKHIDQQYGIPTVEEVDKASRIVQSSMQHPLMSQLIAETFSFLNAPMRSIPLHGSDQQSAVPTQLSKVPT